MGLLFRRILLFLLPVIIGFILLEAFYRTVPNNYTVKSRYMEANKGRVKTLLFGDSHCLYGLNPSLMDSGTYNLSNVSQSLYFDELLLLKYLPQMPKLQTVVLCIEYANLSLKEDGDEDYFRKYYYHHFMGLEVPSVHIYDPKRYSLAIVQNLSRSMDIVSRYHSTTSIIDCDSLGWGENYLKQNRIVPATIARQRARAHEDGSLDFSENIARINRMISTCRQRNIRVLIVSMPQTRDYTSWLNPVKLQKIFDSCATFESLNPETVRYLNLFQDPRFSDADFYDADHLNDQGAQKCSGIVTEFLHTAFR